MHRASLLVTLAALAACDALGSGPPPDDARPSEIRVSLTWTNGADLDLYVTEPSGERVGVTDPTSTAGGRFLVDVMDGRGPERVAWPGGAAPTGEYVVWVDHYSGPSPVEYAIRIESPAYTGTFRGTVGDGATALATRFRVPPADGAPPSGDLTARPLLAHRGPCPKCPPTK